MIRDYLLKSYLPRTVETYSGRRLRRLWLEEGDKRMEKKVILVTGANGYVGSNVVAALLDLGQNVIAVGRNIENIDNRANIIKSDIFDFKDTSINEFGLPDICIHLAWRDGFIHNSIAHLDDLPLHYRFLEKLVSSGLKRLVVMGSMHELGYVEGVITSKTPTNPQSLYGVSKNALRESLVLLSAKSDFCLQWLRGFYIVGQDERNSSIFTKILEAANRNEALFPFTTGENKYDFINIEDLALEISLTSLQQKHSGIINCCSGKAVSLKDRVEDFIKANGLNIKLDYGAFPNREYDSPIIYGDSSVIRKILTDSSSYFVNNPLSDRFHKLLKMLGS